MLNLLKSILRLTPMIVMMTLFPALGFCSVESTLISIQSQVINVLLPLFGILGIAWAAFSFFMGSPNAKNHLVLAMLGVAVGFLAPGIIALIRSLVN